MIPEAAREVLVPEARELLAAMEAALLEMESKGSSAERINAVFRAAHTIKGSAGLFGLNIIVSFTQTMESVLDRVRNNVLALDEELMGGLINSGDYLGALVTAIAEGTEEIDPDPTTRAALLAIFEARLSNTPVSPSPTGPAALAPVVHAQRSSAPHWHISLKLNPQLLKTGRDPIELLLYLRKLGDILYLHTNTRPVPDAEHMDPELCYLGFELGLLTTVEQDTLERAFDLFREGSDIRLIAPKAEISKYIRLIESMPEERQYLGEILVNAGVLTRAELDAALTMQGEAKQRGDHAPLGELLIQEQMVEAPVVAAALKKQKQAEERRSTEQRVVRVDASKLDQLINLVGELVIASEGARLKASRARNAELVESLGKVGQLVEHLRDRALDMRMVPIGEVFQRFPRVVRDVSKELGKKIELVITGAEAELDKSMVEKLSDPLLHIVRNAIDHGMEPVDERERNGKRAEGVLHLHAFHESGCIVIEISDDGRGLNCEKIRAKAVERGLIADDVQLTNKEIHELIFQPGFSTANEVTSLSGRGVGMDVVRRNVEQLRGEVEIQSEKGKGTTFRIRLPLTLAIIDGFQVAVGDSVFVIPLDMVVECVDMSSNSRTQQILSLRGMPLPFVRLRDLFRIEGKAGPRESLVVVAYGQQRVGILVDRLLGDIQAVIKPLGQLFRGIKAVSSSTILGDGTVALILDVPTLISRAHDPAVSAQSRNLIH